MNLRVTDVKLEGPTAYSTYRGKGGKTGRHELPRPAHDEIVRTLVDWGQNLATMDPEASLWQVGAGPQGIISGTFYGRFRLGVDRGG